MPYSTQVKILYNTFIILDDFIKETRGFDTKIRLERTFGLPILMIYLRCFYTNIGLSLDLYTLIREERAAAKGLYFDGILLDYDHIVKFTFQNIRKNVLLFKEVVGLKIEDIKIISDKNILDWDSIGTQFKIAEISIRNEPNLDRYEIF